MRSIFGHQSIATILRHDSKVTSYKIALLRAINDVVLAFPDVSTQRSVSNGEEHQEPFGITVPSSDFISGGGFDVAVPLRMLAQFWIAYYWPFVDAEQPIYQGPRAFRDGVLRNDMDFRPALTELRQRWEISAGVKALPPDGFFLQTELGNPRRAAVYPLELRQAYSKTVRVISKTLQMPIRYAGPENWTVFERPATWSSIRIAQGKSVVPVPGTQDSDVCLVVQAALWESFRSLSLWVEALSIHEWCLFTERVAQDDRTTTPLESTTPLVSKPKVLNRGDVYFLLTARPGNRRPLTWERNQVDLLIMEGVHFTCPWTKKTLAKPGQFDIDHLLPLAIYPINDLWNLLPVDSHFNQHVKRDRLPSLQRLSNAMPLIAEGYANYEQSQGLAQAIKQDALLRFANLAVTADFSSVLARRTVLFIEEVAQARNIARF